MSEWASPDPGSAASPSPDPATPPPPPASPSPLPPAATVLPGSTGSVPAWASVTTTRRGVVPLRPLTTGEVLDGAITTMRRNPRPMFTLGAIAAVVLGVVQLVSYALTSAGATFTVTSSDADGTEKATAFPVASTLLTYLTMTFLYLIVAAMAAGVLRQALVGRPATTADLRVVSFRRLFGAASLVTLIVGALTFTLVGIPVAIFSYVVFAFVGPVLALEGCGIRTALRRSRTLVKGTWWRTFGILALAGLISYVIRAMLSVPAVLIIGTGNLLGNGGGSLSFTDQLVLTLSAAVGALLTAPFTASVYALLYVDRRMRTEGLDVALRQATDAQPDA